MLADSENGRNFPLSAYRRVASLNCSMKVDNRNIESHLKEKRIFKPAKCMLAIMCSIRSRPTYGATVLQSGSSVSISCEARINLV